MLLYLHFLNKALGRGFCAFGVWFFSCFLFKIFSTEIPPEAGTKAPVTDAHTLGAAFEKVSPLDNEPHPKYSGLRALKLQSLDTPILPSYSPSVILPLPPPKKTQILAEGVAVHAREKRKKRKRILLPLQSLKLCSCQVTTNRKSRIKTQPPRPPPSTQHRLH